MVEAPRIRIITNQLKPFKNKTIIDASGASYKKANVNLIGYTIRKIWFAGKYIYLLLTLNTSTYIIRTHLMMYGKITTENISHLTPFLSLTLDNTTLYWYLSQIKFIDANCDTQLYPTNYNTTCTAKQIVNDSLELMTHDISHPKYNKADHLKFLETYTQSHQNEIITDLLLDQRAFPGVGNILQQEALYRCRILPTTPVKDANLNCLIDALVIVSNLLYQSYLDKQLNKPHQPILQIYHKAYCPLNHKTITQYIGYHVRRTTWCPICQH